jgi:tetratricopeptide (TPR) repeat protein
VNGWIHRGDALYVLKDYNSSLQSYSKALGIDGSKSAAWSGMADAYSALKKYTNASAAAANATRFNNQSTYYWLREGNLLQIQGKNN